MTTWAWQAVVGFRDRPTTDNRIVTGLEWTEPVPVRRKGGELIGKATFLQWEPRGGHDALMASGVASDIDPASFMAGNLHLDLIRVELDLPEDPDPVFDGVEPLKMRGTVACLTFSERSNAWPDATIEWCHRALKEASE